MVTPPFRIFSRLNCQGIKAHHHAAVNQEDLAAEYEETITQRLIFIDSTNNKNLI